MEEKKCRFCGRPLERTLVDLGMSPLANSYLKPEHLHGAEPFYPLRVMVCGACFLVQLGEFESPENIFGDYAYFSSYSETWLKHASEYAIIMTARLGLNPESLVVEIASNDGYLLQYFREKGIPVLGIEPAANVAQAAEEKGIQTLVEFFGAALAEKLAADGKQADLIAGNNVLAHVPDLNDFVKGIGILLKPGGTATMEFPHLVSLMTKMQFDTIYHEHFSYFSFTTVEKVFAAHGLTLFDVEELPTHGGSLRIFARHSDGEPGPVSDSVESLKKSEREFGITRLETYADFGEKVKETKRRILDFLVRAKNEGKTIAGYGAPAKGNTLLNYCGVRTDFIDYTVDRSPHKQGLFLPGTHIPIRAPEEVARTKPDYLFILPWNLKEEIMEQMAHIREWGGKFAVPIPRPEVFD
ncbi:MAG: class I SAM-dependent methyltransferase [bacterium]